ncbi:hypothetical protein C5Z26_07620 [Lactobacillus sp. CBA3606]|uniref:hypothetical protein n=1 Tax=Lactobacillus sp. CBA3606 TaxID=2099789 RepID=UPI000CFDC0EA|nr:hypothetical protein [Lactobacillus sp. CBA3606]AVK63985.1 hypothetical protein C5Z26_07620 [Lactobacillus sp. CBA3606]
MSISEIIMWTFVFILATGFITVVSTAVLMRRAKQQQPTAEQMKQADKKQAAWDQDDWAHDDWKKGNWDK